SMRYQGLALSGDERRAIAEYVTGRRLRGTVAGAVVGLCGKRMPLGDPFAPPFWNGWGGSLENTHFQPAEHARLAAADVPKQRPARCCGRARPTIIRSSA